MSDEPKQLKLTPVPEGEFRPKKGKKGEKANKWVVVAVLVVTVIVSLIFYFSGRDWTWGGLFGPKVYRF